MNFQLHISVIYVSGAFILGITMSNNVINIAKLLFNCQVIASNALKVMVWLLAITISLTDRLGHSQSLVGHTGRIFLPLSLTLK